MAGKQHPEARDTPTRPSRVPHHPPTPMAPPASEAGTETETEANGLPADETRRSGRANKGHHRSRDLDEPASAQKPKGKAAKTAPVPSNRDQVQAIREWAKSAGYEVSSRGRISKVIQEAFAAAH